MSETPMERMWRIAPAFVEATPHAQMLGMKFVSVDKGKAALSLPYNAKLVGDPRTRVLHGGAVTSLLDQTCGVAVMAAVISKDESSVLSGVATLDLRIDYLRPAEVGQTVLAQAHCYKLTRHVAFVRALAHDGDEDNPLATCQATFIIKKAKAIRGQKAAKNKTEKKS